MAGKRTSDLIPLCHPLPLTDLVVAVTPDRRRVLRVRAEAATTAQTGVEMEALTAASVAALTIYDMVKGVEKGVEVRASGSCPRPAARAATGIVPPTTAGRRREAGRPCGRQDRPEEAGSGMSGRSALVLTASDRSAQRANARTLRRRRRRALRGARLRRRARARQRRPAGDRGRAQGRRLHHPLVITTGGTA